MSDFYPPFTLYEAEWRLFKESSSTVSLYMGGCLEGFNARVTYDSHRMLPHGDPYGYDKNVDESHSIEISNLWVQQRVTARMPSLNRDGQWILVVVWRDKETGVWAKRTYWKVVQSNQGLMDEGEVFYQNLSFSARYMVEESGVGSWNFTPSNPVSLWYVDEEDSLPLYLYSNKRFNVIDALLLPDRASVSDTGDSWGLSIGASVVFVADDEGIKANSFTALGGLIPVGVSSPRVEIRKASQVLLIVTGLGEVVAPNISEVDVPLEMSDDIIFASNAGTVWRAGITNGILRTVEFSEYLTP